MTKRNGIAYFNNEEKPNSVLKTKATDALYCFYLFSVVLLSTLGMGASDVPYILTVAIGGVFALTRILTSKYDPRWFLSTLLLLLLASVEFAISKRFTLFLTVLLLVGAKDMNIKTILYAFLLAKIIGLLLMFLLVVVGIFKIEIYQYYKMATESFVQRVTVNGAATNVLHLSMLSIIFLVFYLKKGHLSYMLYIAFLFLNMVFEQITHSFLGLFLGTGGLFLFFVLQHSKKIRDLFIRLSIYLLPVIMLFSFGTAILYGSSPFVSVLDRIFQGRISYNHYFLTSTSPSLFGHGMLTAEGNFDNSFVFVFVAYGLIAFILLFGSMQLIVKRLKETRDWVSLAFVILYMIAGLSESFYPAAAVNPSLFMLVPLLSFNGRFEIAKQNCVLNKQPTL